MKKPFNFMVDTIQPNSLSVAKVKQFDTALFNITITENGSALDLSNASLRFFVRKADGKLVFQDEGITIVDAKAGKIAIDVRNSAFQFVGIAVAEIDIRSNDQPIATADFYFDVDEKLGNDEAVKSVIDVDLFTKLSNYIEEALADINKYKGLVEAFTNAGVSIEGLHDIKAYIDSNLDGLKTESNRAAELIPQVNKARTDAEAKRVEVVNTTATAEAKRVDVVNATNTAEAKRVEVVNATNTADAKKKEVDSSTASAESKRVELNKSIETANNSKSALDTATKNADAKKGEVITATNNAESKRVQVVDVTGKAESKRAELQKVIDAVGSADIVTKAQLDATLKGKLDTGAKASDSAKLEGNGLYKGDKGVSGIPVVNKDGVMEVGKYIDFHPDGVTPDYAPRLEATGDSLSINDHKIYHTGFKPSADDVGAVPITGGTINGNLTIGTIGLGGRDLTINGKRALVGYGEADGNELHINYDNDYSAGVNIHGITKFLNSYVQVGTDDRNASLGFGDSDVYIHNSKANTYLQLKDNGGLSFNGKKILTDIQSTPLWKGYHHMSAKETVTPSKPLSQCNNGWVLVWSDWDDNTQGQDWNVCYTFIPKNTIFKNGQNHTCPLSAGETSWAIKTLYIYDTYFKGNDTNKNGDSYDVVIRAVLEY